MNATINSCWPVAILLMVVAAPGRASDDFEKHVRPLLVEKCQSCHGPEKPKGGLRLDSRAALLKGGDSGPAVAPGKPAESLLVKAVGYAGDLKMPPKGKLSDAEIALLTRWIEAGAVWPDSGITPKSGAAFAITHKQRDWWAFQPLKRPEVPAVAPQPVNPIDAFVRAKLDAAGLKPAVPADKRTLLRRVTFDLTGLPPTPEQVDAFLKDDSPEAFAKVVDQLLASPAHGQRWARHWLDVVRYADYHDGNPKARNPVCEPLEAWRYRDWVVQSLNRDLPFDQFIVHQIAGDLLPPPDGNNGREHHPFGFSMWLAGGGIKGGMTHGATDEFGWHAVENKVHVHDLHATILHLMGLDHEKLTYHFGGRDYRLTDVHGHVVKEILA